MKQSHETVMTLAKQKNDRITASLGATLSTMKQENNARTDENANALEAIQTRIDAIEHNTNSSSSGSRKENEQNSVRAVATGFAE